MRRATSTSKASGSDRTREGRVIPTYEIEQYQVHIQRYRVKALNEADAVLQLYKGQGDRIEGSLEFVEVAHDCGMSVAEALALAQELWELGAITRCELVIPSIRSITEVE